MQTHTLAKAHKYIYVRVCVHVCMCVQEMIQ